MSKSISNYVYPETAILINKLGIQDMNILQSLERDITGRNEKIINLKNYTEKDYQSIHYQLFNELYDWAGKYRNERIFQAKKGLAFAPVKLIKPQMKKLFASIGDKNILTPENINPKNMALVFGELIKIHPFREGNGRTTRCFINQILKQNNLQIHWESINKEIYNLYSEEIIIKNDYTHFILLMEKHIISL